MQFPPPATVTKIRKSVGEQALLFENKLQRRKILFKISTPFNQPDTFSLLSLHRLAHFPPLISA